MQMKTLLYKGIGLYIENHEWHDSTVCTSAFLESATYLSYID